MKTDIVERLNLRDASCSYVENIYKDAAAEILRLRAENEKLRAALDDAAVELEFAHFASMNKRYKKAAKTARKAAALKETGDE